MNNSDEVLAASGLICLGLLAVMFLITTWLMKREDEKEE